MAKHLPFSAPRRRSLPTINSKDVTATLQNWQAKLGKSVKNSLPAPTPYNFAVTSVRGGLKLTWAPVQTPGDKALGSPDGYEILKSASGSFTDDLQVIPINNAGQSSYVDSTDGNAQQCHYRIRTTAGTSSNPQSVRGPESGVVSHTSIDSNDTKTVSTTVTDKFTTSKTRSNARLGNYGIDSAFRTSLGTVGGSGQASGASSGSGTSGGTPSSSGVSFDKISGGTNNSAQMVIGGGSSLEFDPADPGVIDSTNIQTIPVTTAAPNDKDALRYVAANGDLEYSPTPRTIAATTHLFLTSYTETTGIFTAAQPADSDLAVSDITTNNVSSTAHGFAPKSPADATKFLNGAATPAYAQVKDSDLSLSNITTNNVSITQHGFTPILPNDATKFLDGTGNWTVPGGGGGGSGTVTSVAMTGDGVIFNSSVTGSPITTTGTLAPSLKTQLANTVLAGPASGPAAAPTFRQIAASELSNGVTGSGLVVLATSPTLVTPNIGTATAGGALNMTSHLINNVTDPASPQDAATKAYVDATAGSSNATSIRGKTVDNDTPVTGDGIYFHSPTWGFGMGGFPTRSYRYDGNGTTIAAVDHFGTSTAMALNPTTGTAGKATATEPPLLLMSTAVSSANSYGIVEGGSLGTNTGIFSRFRMRAKIAGFGTNSRYWIGLFGQTSLQIVGNATWVTNTPTTPGIAFRASQGTDTNWQCVTTTGAGQTTTDSGVAISTAASHVFEFSYDGTNVRFYIDAVLVATQSTNIPTASSTLGNSSMVGGIIADNRTTANTVTYAIATLRIIDLS